MEIVSDLPNYTLAMNVTDNSSTFDVVKYLESYLGERHLPVLTASMLTAVYSLIFMTGVVGNVCTCVVISRNSYMHTATNYYLFSLAISDVLTLLLALFPDVYSLWEAYPWRFGVVFCIMKAYVTEMTAYASILTITAFTIERYFAIVHPIHSQKFSDLSRVVKVIIAVWVIACISAVPYPLHTRLFNYCDDPNGEIIPDSLICTIPPKWTTAMQTMLQVSSFLYFVAPMSIITVIYIRIGLALRRPDLVRRKSKGMNDMAVATASKARKAVLRMLVAVVVAFFLCWAPFHAQRLMTIYITASAWTESLLKIQTTLFYISGVLYCFSSTVNPILYNLMSRRYREAFKLTLSQCICYGKTQVWDAKTIRFSGFRNTSRTEYSYIRQPSQERLSRTKCAAADSEQSLDSKV